MLNYFRRLGLIAWSIALFCGVLSPKDLSALVWKMPLDVFGNPGGAIELAADPFGNAFTAWTTDPGLSVARFSNATQSYGAPVVLSTNNVFNIDVATDASQTALVVWQDDDAGLLLTSFYNGTTWVTPSPSPLDAFGTGFSATLSVDMDGNGNGLAAWRRGNGVVTPPGDIVVSFFNGGTQTWGPLQILNPLGTGGIQPRVGYSVNGTAVVVWTDAANNLIASNFDGVSWTALPPVIGTNVNPSSTERFDVQIDNAGNALAMWQDSVTNQIFSNYFTAGAWGAPQNVSGVAIPAGEGIDFALAPASGTAISVWSDPSNVGQYSEFIGGVWTAPQPFAANVDTFPYVAVDSVGNAVITWSNNTLNQTLSITKPFGGPLGTTDLVTTADAFEPSSIALSDNGRAFIDGFEPTEGGPTLGTYTLFSLNIFGSVCNNKFATQTDRVHIITWTPSLDPSIFAYQLTRNGVVIAVIPATGPLIYEDHNRCRRVSDVYTLTPISIDGTPLAPPAVIVLR